MGKSVVVRWRDFDRIIVTAAFGSAQEDLPFGTNPENGKIRKTVMRKDLTESGIAVGGGFGHSGECSRWSEKVRKSAK
jgi:hypothetical protein